MQSHNLATPQELAAALLSSRQHWRTMRRRYENMDELVRHLVSTPLFRHIYETKFQTHDLDAMVYDVRSGASLLASNIFTEKELAAFDALEMPYYLNYGLALAARHLRPRVQSIATENFVSTVRQVAFTHILKLIGEDLKDPRETFRKLINQFDLLKQEKLALLDAALVNAKLNGNEQTLH